MVKRNRFTRAFSFRIAKWVEGNWSRIESMTRDDAAKTCTRELEVEISPEQLSNIIKDMGRTPKWIIKRNGGSGSGPGKDRTRYLAKQIILVVAELERVCGLLGEEFDPEETINTSILQQMVNGKSPHAEEEREG